MTDSPTPEAKHDGAHAVQVGAGNIGTGLTPLLAREPGLSRLTIIDHDVYEPRNLRNQDISPDCVGRPKAEVMAERARAIRPELDVTAAVARVEYVPLGRLRGDVMFSCVDSRIARQTLSEAAWHLGMPLIDAGVNAADGLLARVALFVPTANGPCLQCGWEQRDYDALEQSHPCDAAAPGAPPTNAPLCLGTLAASLQALEGRKLLAREEPSTLAGRQDLIDAEAHRQLLTSFRRNPKCRFDHEIWDIRPLEHGPGETTVADALDDAVKALGSRGRPSLVVEGRPFVRELVCGACGRRRSILKLAGRFCKAESQCDECNARMEPVGFSLQNEITVDENAVAARRLADLGVLEGDLLRVRADSGATVRFEIGRDRM